MTPVTVEAAPERVEEELLIPVEFGEDDHEILAYNLPPVGSSCSGSGCTCVTCGDVPG